MWLSGGALVNIVPTKTCVSHRECWITLQQPRSSMWKPRWRYRSSVSNRVLLVYGPKNWERTQIKPSASLLWSLFWDYNNLSHAYLKFDSLWNWSENRKVGQSLPKDSVMDSISALAECAGTYCQARGGINEVGPETVTLQDRADLLRSIYKLDKRWEIINQYMQPLGANYSSSETRVVWNFWNWGLVEFVEDCSPWSASALAPAPQQNTTTSCHSGSSGSPWLPSFQRMEPREKCTGNLLNAWYGDKSVTGTQCVKPKQLQPMTTHRISAVLDTTGWHILPWSCQSRVRCCWHRHMVAARLSPVQINYTQHFDIPM